MRVRGMQDAKSASPTRAGMRLSFIPARPAKMPRAAMDPGLRASWSLLLILPGRSSSCAPDQPARVFCSPEGIACSGLCLVLD